MTTQFPTTMHCLKLIKNNLKEQFIEFPKFLDSEDYEHLSNNAKLTYMYMRDRVSLSELNGEYWYDETGVYIYFTQQNIMDKLKVSNTTASAIKKELVTCGLLDYKKQGLNKPDKIYIMVPVDSKTRYFTGHEESSRQDIKKLHSIKTESIKTQLNNN